MPALEVENEGWTTVTFRNRRYAGRDPLTIDQALVTSFSRQKRSEGALIGGAVHDSTGKLVPESERLAVRGGPQRLRPHNPSIPFEATNGPDLMFRSGRWEYCGHWMGHFGHFLMETLSQIPARPPVGTNLLFHRFVFSAQITGWQRDLLALAGIEPTRIHIITETDPPIQRVESLVLRERSVQLGYTVSAPALGIWDKVAQAAQKNPNSELIQRVREHAGRVFFSRTKLADDARFTPGDKLIDKGMAKRGFLVVHPQELQIADQVYLASRAQLISGTAGSNLLLSAFAGPGVKIMELADRRSLTKMQPMQLAVSEARKHQTALVPYFGTSTRRDFVSTMNYIDSLL